MLFNTLYNAPPEPSPAEPREAILEQVRPAIQEVLDATGNYHPIYKLDHVFGTSRRKERLRFACDQVLLHYRNYPPQHYPKVRILDVGCFFGYTSLTLAETFPRVIGCDTNPDYVKVCKGLAAYHGSDARFHQLDIFSADVEEHGIDCVLFLNMLHQVIFLHGLDFVQSYLGRLAHATDVMFLELARFEEYEHHETEHPLPKDPAEVLAECGDCRIASFDGERPFYKVERKRLTYFDLAVEKIDFHGFQNPQSDKKNFTCENGFLKVFRHREDNSLFARNEYNGLHAVRRHEISPYPYELWEGDSHASVLMERIDGKNLHFLTHHGHMRGIVPDLLRQLMRMLAVLAKVEVYQNDFSLQNLLVDKRDRLILVDYEHASARPLYDYFGFLLWNLYDWHTTSRASVEQDIFPRLEVDEGQTRVSPEFYPDIDAFGDGVPRELLEDAFTADSWLAFTQKWAGKLKA